MRPMSNVTQLRRKLKGVLDASTCDEPFRAATSGHVITILTTVGDSEFMACNMDLLTFVRYFPFLSFILNRVLLLYKQNGPQKPEHKLE
jgi:hypothetical protein